MEIRFFSFPWHKTAIIYLWGVDGVLINTSDSVISWPAAEISGLQHKCSHRHLLFWNKHSPLTRVFKDVPNLAAWNKHQTVHRLQKLNSELMQGLQKKTTRSVMVSCYKKLDSRFSLIHRTIFHTLT